MEAHSIQHILILDLFNFEKENVTRMLKSCDFLFLQYQSKNNVD